MMKYAIACFILLTSVYALADAQETNSPTVNNWGKWGLNDKLGTLNYITPEKVIEASQEIKDGKVFNLAIDLTPTSPGWTGRSYQHYMVHSTPSLSKEGGVGFADDMIIMHLQYSTQWDGLSHVMYDGKTYNGYPAPGISRTQKNDLSIHQWANKVVTRAVLLDIAHLKEVEYLDKGYVISPQDLEAAERAQQVEVLPGDIVLIRTGWMNVMKDWATPLRGKEAVQHGEPGLGIKAARWLKDKQVAAVASDTLALEAIPYSADDVQAVNRKGAKAFPVHVELLVNQGMPIGELWNLEKLADDCREDGRYTMFLSAPPLRVIDGVGSVLSPVAIK